MTVGRTAASERARRASRSRLGYLVLGLLAYVPVLLTAPGKVAADTKQYLYLDPGRLLTRAWSMWDPNIGFGTVTHQNIGYLFPMGPFYWLGQTAGVPDWVAQRLWLGSILFAAGLGMLFLFRSVDVRGPAAVVGALAFMLSPYTLDYAARISVILLPWAALPWMVALLIRSLREGGWWHAAWFAVVVQIVGGVNATALVFAGIGPAAWVLHTVLVTRETPLRRAAGTVARIGALTAVTSAWWIAGLWAQGSYGINILKYTETLRAVSRTSMPNEVLRGLGYWFFYGRDKLGPWIEASPDYTQRPLMILLSYGIPVLALVGAACITWRYRSYFVGLVAIGVVIAVGAHPYETPTPIGAWFKELAATSTAAFALRSTGRATPLVAFGLAALLAAGVAGFVEWVGDARWGMVVWRAVVPVAVGVLVVMNLPALWNGTFYGKNLQRDEDVPQYWRDATELLDRQGSGTRVLELPGADFASYRWGNTVDPITPGMTDRPYVARELIPYGSAASANLLDAFDLRVQNRALPASALAPMARLMGVGDIVLRNDIQFERYRVLRPEFLQALFTPTPPGLERAAAFGKASATRSSQYPFEDEQALGSSDAPTTPRPVEVFRVSDRAGIVRAVGADHPVLMSGDGEGVVDLASIGLVDGRSIVLASASFDAAALASQLTPDAAIVVTDSNREQARRWSTVTDNLGYTEGPGNRPIRFDESDAQLDVFPHASPDATTRVVLRGARRVGATSYGNPITYTPEDRPARAFDGDVNTAWRTGAFADVRGERILVEADHPITTDHVNLVQVIQPPRDRWITRAVLRFDGGHPVEVDLRAPSRTAAGQTIEFGRRTFRTFSVEIRDTNLGQLRNYGGIDPVGFAEIRLQGDGDAGPIRVSEVTVLPTDMTRALAERTADHPLVYAMSRQRVIPVPPRHDPELAMTRRITVPTARDFGVGLETRLSTWAADDRIDRLLGYEGPLTATASARLAGAPRDRASAAFDGDPATAWVTPFVDVEGQWLRLEMPQARTIDHLDLTVLADGRHSVPTRLRLESETGEIRDVTVPPVTAGANGTATTRLDFPPLRASTLTTTVTRVAPTYTREWYCECDQAMPVGIAELGVPDVAPIRVAETIPPECRDDLLRVDGTPVPGRVVGTTAAALSSEPLRVEQCDRVDRPTVQLAAGRHELHSGRGDETGWNVDRIVLASTADGAAASLGAGAAVQAPVEAPTTTPSVRVTGRGRATVRAEITGASAPFWLVLGQSENAGWRATVDGRDLGASTLVNGFGNGWRIEPRGDAPLHVSLEWVPQRTVNLALGTSVAGGLLVIGILVVAGVRRGRRRRIRVPGTGGEPAAGIAFAWPWQRRLVPVGAARTVGAAVLAGGFGAVAVRPLVGVVVGAVVLATRWSRGVRVALRAAPPVLLAACGGFITAKQMHGHYPATFEWPTFFAEIRTVGWLVVVLLVADALLGERSRPATWSHTVDDVGVAAAEDDR